MATDHDVIDADQAGQRADRENDRQRRKSRREKREPDDVGLARAPVAVKQRGRAFPIHIARPLNVGWDQYFSCIKRSALARRGPSLCGVDFPRLFAL